MWLYAFILMALCTLKRSCAQHVEDHAFVPWGARSSTTTTTEATDVGIVVKIESGELRGRRVVIPQVPWLPGRDRREVQSPTHGRNDISPVPWQNDISVYYFLGIPFAQKPVGKLRFKPPQKLSRLPDGRLDAFQLQNACPQDVDERPSVFRRSHPYQFNVDEDCLYLNVYTPDVSQYTTESFPVVVFLHGGGFQYGSANDWPGHVLASKGLVVVTLNYRLGAYGFLSIGYGSGANYGLLDQRMAMEWVRDNIFAFNGDFQKVALIGHGAGAASVGLHMLSPGSAGLFHVAGALSGADTSYHRVITDQLLALNNTVRLGQQVGCSQKTPEGILECIKTRSPNDIIKTTNQMRVEYNRYAFLPLVDGHFLPGAPEDLLGSKQVASSVAYMTGVNTNDGSEALLSDRLLSRLDFRLTQGYLDQSIIQYTLQHNYTYNREAAIQAIKYQYSYWPDVQDDERMRQQFMRMCSDAYYVAPCIKSARMHADAGSVTYLYVNNYKLNTRSERDAKMDTESLNPLYDWLGVFHTSDLYLLFGFPWMPKTDLPKELQSMAWTSHDRNMSEYFMESIRQFALKRDPNLALDATWVNLNQKDLFYLDFNVTKVMKEDYRWVEVAFWNTYLTQISNLWTTTISPTIRSLMWERRVLQGVSALFIFLTAIAAFLAATFAYLLFLRPGRRPHSSTVSEYSIEDKV